VRSIAFAHYPVSNNGKFKTFLINQINVNNAENKFAQNTAKVTFKGTGMNRLGTKSPAVAREDEYSVYCFCCSTDL